MLSTNNILKPAGCRMGVAAADQWGADPGGAVSP